MNHLAIIRILSIIGIWVAGLMLVCGILASALDQFSNALPFYIAAVLAGPIGAIILLLTNRPLKRSRAQEGLAVAVLFWVVVPALCAIPFLPLAKGNFIIAFYESVSCLTTTGHSVLDLGGRPMPASLLIWRAMLHLLGAIAVISMAASVLAAMNLGGPGVHKSRFFTISEGSFFDTIPRIVRFTSVMICAIALVLGSLLLIIGVGPREALSGAVGAVTTGLVDPNAPFTAPSGGPFHAALLAIGLIAGTLGLVVLDLVSRGQFIKVAIDPEVLTFGGVMAVVTILALFAGLPLMQSLGWSLSSISTSGMALSDPERMSRLSLVLVLVPVLIGGSALSAAGGVKLGRLIVLSKRVTKEFVQLGYRGSVQTFKYRGRRQGERTVMGVWVYLVGYIMATVAGVLLLSLDNVPFDDCLRATVGSLANAGHIIAETSEAFGTPAQMFIILGMILGRLEVIALIPVLSPSFWSR